MIAAKLCNTKAPWYIATSYVVGYNVLSLLKVCLYTSFTSGFSAQVGFLCTALFIYLPVHVLFQFPLPNCACQLYNINVKCDIYCIYNE